MTLRDVSRRTETFAPSGAYREPLRVRSYDVGRAGYVRPGMIMRYLEHIATEASASLGFDAGWYVEHGTAWLVREMSLLMDARAAIGDELELATWLASLRHVQAVRDYAAWLPASQRLVASARARWAYVNRQTGAPHRVHDALSSLTTTHDSMAATHGIRTRREIAGVSAGARWMPAATWYATARAYETDVNQHINNCVYADWLEESLLAAAANHGLAIAAWRPRRWRIEYLQVTLPGDAIRIETRLALDGTRRLVAHQQLVRSGPGGDAAVVRAEAEYLRPCRV